MSIFIDFNESIRQIWLKKTLTALPAGIRLLDAGAGELKNRQYCGNLTYVSQDFCQYKGAVGALDEGLQTGGMLILTAPFAPNVHMAPYHFCSGFSKYWYEHHLAQRGFDIKELTANGDWYALLRQEIIRLGGLERSRGNWAWPLAYAYAFLGVLCFKLRSNNCGDDLACLGWQCVAVKSKVIPA